MGILDSLFGAKPDIPAPSKSAPMKARGGSGRQHTGGFLDYDETSNKLRGRAGLDVLDRMWRTDADCRRAITLCINPIVAGTWEVKPFEDTALEKAREAAKDEQRQAEADQKRVEQHNDAKNPPKLGEPPAPKPPAPEFVPSNQQEIDALEEQSDSDKEVAEFVTWALFEEMIPKLESHMWTALTVAGRCGFAPFEQVYKTAEWNGRTVFTLKSLDLRRPQSVDRWIDDGAGTLLAIEQYTPGGGEWSRATIPAQDLIYYRFGAEGDNWEGQGLLRAAYKHFMRKEGLELIDVMGHEKTSMGVPTGYPPTSTSPEELEAFDEFLENVRASSDTFIRMPGPHAQFADKGQGWYWEFVTPGRTEGSTKALQESLKYHTDKIAAVVIAEFMRLGQSGTGARATADVQQDPFWMFAETLAKIVVEDAINEQLIPRLVDLNFDVKGRYPKVSCSLIDSTTLAELGTYVKDLAGAGAIRTEPRLEAYLRKRGDLPEADEDAIKAQSEAEAAQQSTLTQQHMEIAGKVATEEAKAKLAPKTTPTRKLEQVEQSFQLTLDRQDLRGFETYMSLDRIEAGIDGARAAFEAAAGPAVRELSVQLAKQAAKGRHIRPAAGPTDLTTAVAGELADLYRTGRATVREELLRQQAGDPSSLTQLAAEDDPVPGELAARGQAASDNIRQAVVTALGRVGFHRGTDQAILQAAAEQAGMAALRGEAMEHAAAALNLGRTDQADDDSDEIAGTYYTSILDQRRCSACEQADDDVLRALDDPVRLSRVPPNPACEGGGKCRCMEAYVHRSEASPSA